MKGALGGSGERGRRKQLKEGRIGLGSPFKGPVWRGEAVTMTTGRGISSREERAMDAVTQCLLPFHPVQSQGPWHGAAQTRVGLPNSTKLRR